MLRAVMSGTSVGISVGISVVVFVGTSIGSSVMTAVAFACARAAAVPGGAVTAACTEVARRDASSTIQYSPVVPSTPQYSYGRLHRGGTTRMRPVLSSTLQ